MRFAAAMFLMTLLTGCGKDEPKPQAPEAPPVIKLDGLALSGSAKTAREQGFTDCKIGAGTNTMECKQTRRASFMDVPAATISVSFDTDGQTDLASLRYSGIRFSFLKQAQLDEACQKKKPPKSQT